ncbi:MAG: hypothetical protein IPG34_20080 [Rhodocyclaceae bacterium]|nr:hypothetical protein [Rhodocyclaceae bacterium]
MPFPVVLGRNNSATTANNTSHAISFSDTPTDGDLLIVFVALDGNTTPTWPAGWTQVFLRRTSQNEMVGELRYRVASSNGSSITITTPSEEMQARSWIIGKGTFASPPEIEAATASGSSTVPDPPSLTPSWGSDKNGWLALVGTDVAQAVSNPPANYAQVGTANSGGSGGVGIGYGERQLEAASDNPSAATITSAPWVAATVAVRGRSASSARSAVTSWVEGRLSALASLQDAYASAHGGRYFQGVAWTAAADGADTNSNLSLKPHDQAEGWADFGASLPSRVPAALAINVYNGPQGWGYTVTARVLLGGEVWTRVWSGSADPDESAVDWYVDTEPVA